VGLWDVKTARIARSFRDTTYTAQTLAFSPDWKTIAAGGAVTGPQALGDRPNIVLWETATGRKRLQIAMQDRHLNQLAISLDGRLLAATGDTETIVLWSTWTGKEVGRFTGHRGRIASLAFAPDGKSLASGSDDCNVMIWDVSGLMPAAKFAENLNPESLAKCWNDLASTDAARAYQVIGDLAQRPEQALALLKDKLAAFPKPDAEHVARLLADLDDKDFNMRQKVSVELAKLGRIAEVAMRKALENNPSAEAKQRITDLLEKLEDDAENPERWRRLRVIELLERIATPQARELLESTAKEAGDGEFVRESKASLARLAKVAKVK